MPTLAKPQMWWPGCNILHPLCPDFAWMMWEGAGSRVGCVGKRVGNPDQFAGTLTNMNNADWVGSPYGWALDFDGVNDICSASRRGIPSGLPGELLTLTVHFALRSATVASDEFIVGINDEWFLIHDNPTNRLYFITFGGNDGGMIWAADTGWHTYTHVWWPGAGHASWLDGVSYAVGNPTDINTSGVSGNSLKFGARSPGAEHWDGQLGSFSITTHALTPNEVAELYLDSFNPFRPRGLARLAPTAAIMNQMQFANLGADLYNGTLVA